MIQLPPACASLQTSCFDFWMAVFWGKEKMAPFYRHDGEIPGGIPSFEPVIRLLLLCVTEIASCEITYP